MYLSRKYKEIIRKITVAFFLITLLSILAGCSINRLAVNMMTDMLAGGESTVFTGDEDLELIGEALPFALKLYESLLEADPDNARLLLATGKAFCLYAFAYVQTPAEMLPYEEYKKQEYMLERAKKLYLRAKNHLFHALDLENPAFIKAFKENTPQNAFVLIKEKDLPYIYWTGVAWMGAITTDPFDVSLTVDLPNAAGFIMKVIEMDDSYEHGAPHELLVSYYGSLPEGMGGSEEKARFHFQKAVQYSNNQKAAPYLALATSICISRQNIEEFKELLDKVLKIDISEPSEYRLLNILAQEKTAWYYEHIDDFFITESE
ncbi:MAG: TRAP transporter TatT component family protein [Spirochaetales bacterium]|nr:TRAP transporter TatT component family protein [Spirochaetales bacterium]